MVRPRLVKSELAYLNGLLTGQIKELEAAKLKRVQLGYNIYNLNREWQRIAGRAVFKDLKAKQQMLSQAATEQELRQEIWICRSLLSRFNRILDGATKGRADGQAQRSRELLNRMDPKTCETLETTYSRLINTDQKEGQNKPETTRNIDGLTLLCNVKQPFQITKDAQIGLSSLPLINWDIEGGGPPLTGPNPIHGC